MTHSLTSRRPSSCWWRRRLLAGALASIVTAGCAIGTAPAPDRSGQTQRPPSSGSPAQRPAEAGAAQADPRDRERIARFLIPLMKVADRSRNVSEIRVAITSDPEINAANGGNGQFIVTRGLLDRAPDEMFQGILAHEVAHDDLGHVAKAQVLGTGVQIGAALLSQIFPSAGQIAPIAGTLITRAYGRSEELAADRHGVELLRRVGARAEAMERTLVWLKQQSGGDGGGGGFLSTHPAIDERIEALRAQN